MYDSGPSSYDEFHLPFCGTIWNLSLSNMLMNNGWLEDIIVRLPLLKNLALCNFTQFDRAATKCFECWYQTFESSCLWYTLVFQSSGFSCKFRLLQHFEPESLHWRGIDMHTFSSLISIFVSWSVYMVTDFISFFIILCG